MLAHGWAWRKTDFHTQMTLFDLVDGDCNWHFTSFSTVRWDSKLSRIRKFGQHSDEKSDMMDNKIDYTIRTYDGNKSSWKNKQVLTSGALRRNVPFPYPACIWPSDVISDYMSLSYACIISTTNYILLLQIAIIAEGEKQHRTLIMTLKVSCMHHNSSLSRS